MISYLKGTVVAKRRGCVVLGVNGVGYEVHLPGYVEYCLRDSAVGSEMELYILYHHPEQQPRPRLFGFRNEVEREFFEALTTVQDIGPTKAIAVFAGPVGRIARAIADGDERTLTKIKGIGPKLAKKIIAALSDKAGKFALLPADTEEVPPRSVEDIRGEVVAALTTQLGHRKSEAQEMIGRALKRKPEIASAEELFEEVYRGEKPPAST